MGWFDEQILQRKLSDQEIMEDSLRHIAAAVLGSEQSGRRSDAHGSAKAAIGDILEYYHIKPSEIPEDITDTEEQLEYALRPHGIMWRSVRLEEGWNRRAMGPMMAFRREDGAAAALLPLPVSGYRYRDPVSGDYRRVSRKAAAGFSENAFCFYEPLPLKELSLHDLLVYLKNRLDRGDYALLFALTLAGTMLGLLMTNITRTLTGSVLESGSVSLLAGTAAFMLSVILSARLIGAARQLTISRIGTKASVALEAALMMRIMNLPAGFYRQHASGELASRYSAVGRACEQLVGNLVSTGLGALLSLLYITQVFYYAPALAVPALLVILLGVALSMLTGFLQMRVSRKIAEKNSKESGLSYELISGVRKIRLAGAEKRAFAKWAHIYAESAELAYHPPMLIRVNPALASAVALAGTVVLFCLAVKTAVTPSEYIAFNTAYGAASASFSALAGVVLSFAAMRPVLEMAEPILRAVPESSENRSMVRELKGNVELSNVYYRYDRNMPWVIEGMDLKIRAGEYIGIVGTTGCGKSTLVRLLLGFETPEKGAVYYDRRDLNGLDLHSLRRRIGTVMQDGILFQGDIFSNISVSAPQMTLAEAWEAAETAGIAEDIRRMPMGMQTQIQEDQGGISGGQKQRLLIARAIAPKPRILIFDEATSALDNRTQKQIADALDRLKCTRIVIAHRLSTIRNCSRILVMHQGKFIEEGTYEELIAKGGLFSELVARQRLDV